MATELTVDDQTIAVRSWGGSDRGTIITMMVTKDQWEEVKHRLAQTDGGTYDIATAEAVVRDWMNQGATIVWKSAADFNKQARDLKQHRFRNDPRVASNFDAAIDSASSSAKDTMRSTLKSIKD